MWKNVLMFWIKDWIICVSLLCFVKNKVSGDRVSGSLEWDNSRTCTPSGKEKENIQRVNIRINIECEGVYLVTNA